MICKKFLRALSRRNFFVQNDTPFRQNFLDAGDKLWYDKLLLYTAEQGSPLPLPDEQYSRPREKAQEEMIKP